MEKQIYDETNGLYYVLGEDGLYYPELELPEGIQYDIGKYGIMRLEYLAKYNRAEYIRLFLEGVLNGHLHELDEECHERMEILVEQMKIGTGITEQLKQTDQMKWVGVMNNVGNAAEEIMVRELIYV